MVFIQSIATLSVIGFASGSNTTPDNVSSRLQIQIPKSLFRPEGYDHREALFGNPPYGGSISQTLFYTDSDLCDQNVDPTKGFPRRSDNAPWEPPFILMADRGDCSFVQKARNAQHAGAAGLIIADNLCLCHDQKCLNSTKPDGGADGSEGRSSGDLNPAFIQCENNEPIMADDGSGGDITIPAFLMFKVDADEVKKELRDNNLSVQLEMSWTMPNPDSKVDYELWTVPSEEISKPFQKEWKDVALVFGDHSRFTPHQYVYDGVKSRCHQADGKNLCLNLCTNHGRYCATDPDNDLEHGISGAQVVREALRRICVWNKYGEDGIGLVYWDYIAEFLNRCDNDDYFANQDCINDVYKHAKIDGNRIEDCMEDSGGTTSDKGNTLLEREIDSANRRGVVVLPTMFVNTVALRGALETKTVFSAVCAGFHEGSVPEICDKCNGCADVAECVKKGGSCKKLAPGASSASTSSGGVSKKTFGLTLLFICSLFGIIGYLHWKKTREDMRDQVRGILAEYMPLEGGDDMGNPMDFARKGQSTSFIS